MLFETERLAVRYIQESDWKYLLEIWADFGESPYAKYDVPHTTSEAEVREKAKRWAEVTPYKEHMFFAVCLGDVMIGYIDFHRHGNGYECGYCFHSAYHGKGYARESMKALLNELSKEGAKYFAAGTALNNLPSVNLLTSLGFQQTGEEQVSFYKDNHGVDIYFDGGIFELATK